VPVACADVGGAREQLSGSVPSGYLVRNPLGDPVHVDWDSIRRLQYQRQANHDEVVEAMSALLRDRATWRARAGEIADEATRRFDLSLAVRRHDEVLRAVADRKPLQSVV
jgi:glycosyltransferase involved in cell wall biosynthesis